MRKEEEVSRAIDRYTDTVFRICMLHLKNKADTEDIVQEVFLKYALHSAAFESEEHEKAWMIRVTVNACKDLLKSLFRSRTDSLEDYLSLPDHRTESGKEVLEAVLSLPEKYRDAIYLHYFEGYSAQEAGKILRKSPNTIYTQLARGRKMLMEKLGGDEHEGID